MSLFKSIITINIVIGYYLYLCTSIIRNWICSLSWYVLVNRIGCVIYTRWNSACWALVGDWRSKSLMSIPKNSNFRYISKTRPIIFMTSNCFSIIFIWINFLFIKRKDKSIFVIFKYLIWCWFPNIWCKSPKSFISIWMN